MNIDQIRENLTQKILNQTEHILEQKAATLTAFLKYELSVMNTELALSSDDHGYDFQFLSDAYVNNIVISPVQTTNGSVTMSITIPRHAYKDSSDSEVEFFRTFVLANALRKLNRMK